MAAANNEFFEALSMLEHERGITAEYLIEKIKAAIVIAVKKNYVNIGIMKFEIKENGLEG